jgi:hypothetical protein
MGEHGLEPALDVQLREQLVPLLHILDECARQAISQGTARHRTSDQLEQLFSGRRRETRRQCQHCAAHRAHRSHRRPTRIRALPSRLELGQRKDSVRREGLGYELAVARLEDVQRHRAVWKQHRRGQREDL